MSPSSTPVTTLGFDADDTLWHHENYFNEAKDAFHATMNTFGTYPDAGDLLDAKHIEDLSLWGYGVKSYTLTMVELAITMTNGTINGHQMQRIFDIGKALYRHPIILLDHVRETLEYLKGRYRLLIITKGDLIAQEMKISKSGLASFFDGIEIVSEKNEATYQRILTERDINPAEFVMIGNSVRSDILPPLHLGARAVHIPYHTSWHFEQAEIAETEKHRFVVLPSMEKLVETIKQLSSSAAA